MGATTPGALLCGLIVSQQPAERPTEVWLDLEGDPEPHGLQLIDTSYDDDAPTPAAIGGRECYVVGPGQSWFRLQVDPAFMGGDDEADVTLSIDYFDNGTGPIQFAYDCADTQRLVGGQWATEFPRCRAATEEWRTLRLCLPRARFRRHQNGADLAVGRHSGGAPQYLYLTRIGITRAFLDVKATPPAVCIDDAFAARLTITARGPDGEPAADGTQIDLLCEQGIVAATVTTTDGAATGEVTVDRECGEARVEVTSPWSAREVRLPVLEGSGGVVEVRCPLLDFEQYGAGDEVVTKQRPADAKVNGVVIDERRHKGKAALRLDYAFPGQTGDAILPVDKHLAGYVRGFELYAVTELNWPPEFRFYVEDASGESFVFAAQLPQKEGEWLRYWAPFLDPLTPAYGGDENQRLDQPLFLREVGLAARSTHKLAPGTIDLDDLCAITWLGRSEVPDDAEIVREIYPAPD